MKSTVQGIILAALAFVITVVTGAAAMAVQAIDLNLF